MDHALKKELAKADRAKDFLLELARGCEPARRRLGDFHPVIYAIECCLYKIANCLRAMSTLGVAGEFEAACVFTRPTVETCVSLMFILDPDHDEDARAELARRYLALPELKAPEQFLRQVLEESADGASQHPLRDVHARMKDGVQELRRGAGELNSWHGLPGGTRAIFEKYQLGKRYPALYGLHNPRVHGPVASDYYEFEGEEGPGKVVCEGRGRESALCLSTIVAIGVVAWFFDNLGEVKGVAPEWVQPGKALARELVVEE